MIESCEIDRMFATLLEVDDFKLQKAQGVSQIYFKIGRHEFTTEITHGPQTNVDTIQKIIECVNTCKQKLDKE